MDDQRSERMMPDRSPDKSEMAGQLMEIALDKSLRGAVYERMGNYCHQCRNRLNSLKLSLYLARRQSPEGRDTGRWDLVDRHYHDLESRVDRLQTICRPMTLSPVRLALDLLIEDRRDTWSRLMADRGRSIEFVPPRDRALANFDVERLGQALDAMVAWRAREPDAFGPIKLRWWVSAGVAHINWGEEAERIDVRQSSGQGGDGEWTLPVLARVVNAHGGEFVVDTTNCWRLELSWPSDPPIT